MDCKYFEVKPNKLCVKYTLIALSAITIIIIIMQLWMALIIPFLFLLFSVIKHKTDRIIYNDREVIILAPNGKRFSYSWEQIESAEIVLETVRGRSSNHPRWFLKITYSYQVNGKAKTETMKKLYYLYDGAHEFVELFKAIKEKV